MNLLAFNTATVDQLEALAGIGAAYAEKIIKERPHQRIDELVQKKIFSRATHEEIKWRRARTTNPITEGSSGHEPI